MEEDLTNESFYAAIRRLYENKERYRKNMEKAGGSDPLQTLLSIIQDTARR